MKDKIQAFNKAWREKCSVIPLVHRIDGDEMIKRHYLHKWPGVTVLTLGLKCCEKLLGIIVFALPPRETNKRYGGETWELARLWIDDEVPKNAETWFISKSIKYVVKNYRQVKTLVSYADPSVGHSGTIYKAANWIADGRTDEGRKTPRCDYIDDNGKRYSRKSHIPEGMAIKRIPRTSKYRFIYRLCGK